MNSIAAVLPEQREPIFFVAIAFAIAATVVAGFMSYLAAGYSSFNSPWWVHLHALSFMSWIVLYIAQNMLVWKGSIDVHRKLGKVGAVLALWMVIVGLVTTPVSIVTGRVPPFFTPAFFLALDWVNIIFFAGLVSAALAMRHKSDWHRRLMLCATVCVINPGLARLLLTTELLSPLTMTLGLLSFVIAAVLFDAWNRRQFHKAYLVGAIVLFVMGPLTDMMSKFSPLADYANRLAGN